MPTRLQNPFWQISLDSGRPQLTSLGFDAAGASRWCANLLKTGVPRAAQLPLPGLCGGQSGYVDAAGGWQLSSASAPATVRVVSETEVEIDGIGYGSVQEALAAAAGRREAGVDDPADMAEGDGRGGCVPSGTVFLGPKPVG